MSTKEIINAENGNVVLLSEGEYNNIMKAVRNAEYLAEIDKAAAQFEAGKGQIHDLIEVKDDEYCEQLLQDYLNDPDPHKHDSVSLEEAMELCGVTASEIEALEELEYMKKHPEEYKSYESVDEMFKDILGDEWDPDYTKTTLSERERIEHAESSGFIADEDIDWDHLEKYAE